MKLSIITPSYINSKDRYQFAAKSLESLRNNVGTNYTHIIADDKSIYSYLIPESMQNKFKGLVWNSKSQELYSGPNIKLLRRIRPGSAGATLDALREAKNNGCKLVFIHLDDHVYIPEMRGLMKNAIDAFTKDSELQMLRFSGYPQIYNNYVSLDKRNNQVQFDKVILNPKKEKDYTLWWSYFDQNTIAGGYWPIALWFCIYRVGFLEEILNFRKAKTMRHLANIEVYFKKPRNWNEFIKNRNWKFGYINMQYGGIEMHRNRNWEELLKIPNAPIS